MAATRSGKWPISGNAVLFPRLGTLGFERRHDSGIKKDLGTNRDNVSPGINIAPITTRDVRANLGHLRWNDILAPAIEKHFRSLPLLTDDAFQTLLPAFFFRVLEAISPENQALEWTLHTLCGAYEEDEATMHATNAERQKRFASFTGPQRQSVRAFLELVNTAPKLTLPVMQSPTRLRPFGQRLASRLSDNRSGNSVFLK